MQPKYLSAAGFAITAMYVGLSDTRYSSTYVDIGTMEICAWLNFPANIMRSATVDCETRVIGRYIYMVNHGMSMFFVNELEVFHDNKKGKT